MKNWTNNKIDILNYKKPEGYSKRYCYIPHEVFLDELQEKIDKKGYKIDSERYLGAMDNKIICGSYRINNGSDEMRPAIGFVNSVNRMRVAEVYGYGIVLVCSNGMVNSIGRYRRKHIGDQAISDIRNNIDIVIDNVENEFEKLIVQKEQLKEKEINKSIISKLIGDMYINESLINETQLSILKKEISLSKNFKEMNAWSMYNWVTEALKDNHPLNYDKQHIKFHNYMLDQFEIVGSSNKFKKII